MNEPLFSLLAIVGAGTAVMALTFSTLGWIAALLLRSTAAPLRHNLLLLAVLLTLGSPILAALAHQQGWGGWVWKRPMTPALTDTYLPTDAGWVMMKIPRNVSPLPPTPPRELQEPNLSYWKIEILERWLVPAAFLGWAGGTILGLLGLCRDLLKIARLKQALTQTGEPPTESSEVRLAAVALSSSRLGRATPQIVTTSIIPVPLVVGILRPVIALPKEAWDLWTASEKEAVLLHEAAHIERNDPLIAFLARLTRILFWWCAPLHGAALCLNRLREQICDDHVLDHQGHGKNLARAMVRLVEQGSFSGSRLGPQGLGMLDGRAKDLEVRFRNLLNSRRIAMTRMSAKASWVLFGFSLVALPAGIALQIGAQEPPPKQSVYSNPQKDLSSPPSPVPPAGGNQGPGKGSAGAEENPACSRMRKIVAACQTYAAAHQGQWPKDLTNLKPLLTGWQEVVTHPEHKASCSFHYIQPESPKSNFQTTAVLIETRKGQPDPNGCTAFTDGHLELNTPLVEVVIRLMEAEKPLNINKELPTESEKRKHGGQSTQPLASVHTVLSPEQLRQALTQAQQDRTTNVISAPRMTLLEKQTGVIEVGNLIPKDPKKTQPATEDLSFAGFRVEVTPQLQGDQIQLTVHSELSTSQPQKDGTSKKVEQFDVKWFAKAKSGQTVYLQIEPEKGTSNKYLFLTPTTQKLVPDQGK